MYGRGGRSGGRGAGGRGSGGGGVVVAGTRVYVGNLSWQTSWQSLKDHFRQAGEVVHADVMMADGRSKGCGIVAFATPAEAANAIATLTETELDGRNIFVREDREETVGGLPAPGPRGNPAPASNVGLPPPPRGPVPRAVVPMGGPAANETRVYVGNLSWQTSWQSLKDHFRQAGEVLHADVMMADGRSKGCGIVAFASAADAANAIATLTETELDGRNIFVREDREAAPSQHGAPHGAPHGAAPGGRGGGRFGGQAAAPTTGCQVRSCRLPFH
jgi:RNA recognition motif-containing protein